MSKPNSRRFSLAAIVAALMMMLAGDAAAVVGRPLTPVSYAGVARRTTRRTAYYGGGGYYGAGYAAGYTTAVATTLPAGCAPGVVCHGTVYQPAYSGATVVYVAR